jgi:hypothetical protein
MKLSRLLFSKLSLLFLILSFSKAACAGDVKDWKQYIPVTGKAIQADIMEVQSSQELEKLATKLQESFSIT